MRYFALSLLAFGLFVPALFAQSTSGTTYTNLTVTGTTQLTGTADVNDLNVTGTLDVLSNSTYFGTAGNSAAVTTSYSDGASGAGSVLTIALTRPSAAWVWDRFNASGSLVPVMALTATNQLTLTGTQASNPGAIVLDPTAGRISVNGQSVLLSGNGVTLNSSSGYFGIGTASPGAQLDVEGSGNVILNSGEVGIGANPDAQGNYGGGSAAALFISRPNGTVVQLMNSQANDSLSASQESLEFVDGPGGNLVGEIAGLNADYPGAGLYQPHQLTIWSAGPGGILLLARNWPGYDGPIVFAVGDYRSGEVMRIATNQMVGVGGEQYPASLMSISGNASVGEDYSETSAPQDGLIVEGNVGIGTDSPQYQLDVAGPANFSGPVELAQQGDISMGQFNYMPPNPGGNNDDAISAGPGHFAGFGNSAPATSGTTTTTGTGN